MGVVCGVVCLCLSLLSKMAGMKDPDGVVDSSG